MGASSPAVEPGAPGKVVAIDVFTSGDWVPIGERDGKIAQMKKKDKSDTDKKADGKDEGKGERGGVKERPFAWPGPPRGGSTEWGLAPKRKDREKLGWRPSFAYSKERPPSLSRTGGAPAAGPARVSSWPALRSSNAC